MGKKVGLINWTCEKNFPENRKCLFTARNVAIIIRVYMYDFFEKEKISVIVNARKTWQKGYFITYVTARIQRLRRLRYKPIKYLYILLRTE